MIVLNLSIIITLLIMSIGSTSLAIAQNEGIQDISNTVSNYYQQIVQSPLTQYKSGIDVQNITCNAGLQLVLKAEDGSPACVKPETAQKLMERGWAKFIFAMRPTFSNLQCDGTVIPAGNAKTGIVPVLMLKPNSNATLCITYKFTSDWNSYPNKNIYPNGTFETSCCNFDTTQYPNKQTKNFEVSADPPSFNITGIYSGEELTVKYKIHAESNSTGFYISSIPFGNCNSYPLAVGYDSSQISASDFPSYMLEIPCFNTIDTVESVKIVSGMTYKEIQIY